MWDSDIHRLWTRVRVNLDDISSTRSYYFIVTYPRLFYIHTKCAKGKHIYYLEVYEKGKKKYEKRPHNRKIKNEKRVSDFFGCARHITSHPRRILFLKAFLGIREVLKFPPS